MMEYKHAKKLADRLVDILSPFCIVIDVAGSTRRRKIEVKDIEIVCLPRHVFQKEDLFGNGRWLLEPGFDKAIEAVEHKRVKGQTTGRYLQTILKGGATMDLFMPQRPDYYRQLAIRTGSSTYSHYVLANAWLRKGWCGTHDGLRLISECETVSDNKYKCLKENPTKPPEWTCEQDFFNWLGVNWVEPNQREIVPSFKTG